MRALIQARAGTHGIYVVDMDGPMSVTNDAEGVVAYLHGRMAREHQSKRIFYKDSMGMWDELLHDGDQFEGFAPGVSPEARTEIELLGWS